MNGFAYLRVSGKGQVEGDGFERQTSACLGFAEAQGIRYLCVYREEGISGKTGEEDRPAFQEMIAALMEQEERVVIVESLDRLARQYDIQQQLATYLASKQVTLYSANTGEDITAALMGDPMRRALVQIQGIFAELDKNLTIAKLQKARKRTKEKNGRCEGQKPFGHYEDERVRLELIVKLQDDGFNSERIAAELNASCVPTRSGKPWRGSTIRKILWSPNRKVVSK